MTVIDWTTVVVLIVVNGIVDAGAVAYLSGWWSKRRLTHWLTDAESQPYIDRITEEVAKKIPVVPEMPTVEEISEDVLGEVRPVLAEMEQRLGTELRSFDFKAQFQGYEDHLFQRVSALIASNAHEQSAFLDRVVSRLPPQLGGGGTVGGKTQALSMLLRSLKYKKEADALTALSQLYHVMGPQGQGQPGQPYNPYAQPPPAWGQQYQQYPPNGGQQPAPRNDYVPPIQAIDAAKYVVGPDGQPLPPASPKASSKQEAAPTVIPVSDPG